MTFLFAVPFAARSESSNIQSNRIPPYSPVPRTQPQVTHATWYAGKLVGHRMSGGKRYEKSAIFVATYRPYPFGTMLRITNLSNHRSVIASVEDREPYNPGDRTLDLSYAAAKQLDMISAGVVLVSYSKVIAPHPQGGSKQ